MQKCRNAEMLYEEMQQVQESCISTRRRTRNECVGLAADNRQAAMARWDAGLEYEMKLV